MLGLLDELLRLVRAYLRPQAATYFTRAEVASQAAGTIADSGQLSAGEYELVFCASLDADTTAAVGYVGLEHRNAANTGNVARTGYLLRDYASTNPSVYVRWPRFTVAANERIRVVNLGNAFNAGDTISYSLFVRKV